MKSDTISTGWITASPQQPRHVRTELRPLSDSAHAGPTTCQQWNILGKSVSIHTTSAGFAVWISRLMRGFASANPLDPLAKLRFMVASEHSSSAPATRSQHCQVFCNDEYVGESNDFWQLFRLIEWQLDIFLAANTAEYVLLHAAAVARDERATLLVGESGAGKSSSCLALILNGYRYLSDELAVIDPESMSVAAFPKAFSLKNPKLFPELERNAAAILGPTAQDGCDSMIPVWYIHPADMDNCSIQTTPVPVQRLIFPRYSPASRPTLQRVSSEVAMSYLINSYVNTQTLGTGGLRCLAHLVRTAPAYYLTTPGIDDTVSLLRSLT